MTSRNPSKYSIVPQKEEGIEISVEEDDTTLKQVDHHIEPSLIVGTSPINFRILKFLENWTQLVLFFSYILLYLCYSAWVHVTQTIKYSPAMMVFAVLITKLVVSMIAFRIVDGSIPYLLKTIYENRRHLSLFIFPAFAYATTDSLCVYCLRRLDPATFSILYNIRVVFMLLLFQCFMKVSLRRPHWMAMLTVLCACMIKELPMVRYQASTSMNENNRLWTIVVLLCMAQLAAFAAVYNEKLLKEHQKLGLNIQNIAMYMWAILGTGFYNIVIPLLRDDKHAILSDMGNFIEWKTIWSYPISIAVLLSASYGLVTSFFIKSLNNVVRELACAIHIIATIPVNYMFFGYSIQVTDLIAVILVVAGVYMYNRHPLKEV